MLVFGTEMNIVTFIFVSIEVVIFFYLAIYRLARPDDPATVLNITLIFLLIIYNITGGLLPDPKLPGSFLTQEAIAYSTGFITPCYFPYYVYKAFGLEKMRFHAYKGVYFFLIIPCLLFVIVLAITRDIMAAKNLLILPVFYAIWVIYSLLKAIKYKYGNNFRSRESSEEIIVLMLSITPWIGLPIIAYFELSQAVEASITNTGFLLLFALQVSRQIKQMRIEHQRLTESEQDLLFLNTNLQNEVNKRTQELEKINEQRTNNFINLVHETKTPLTLVNNYLEDYTDKYGSGPELEIIKEGINKLTKDVTSLFDIERFKKGIDVYNHNQRSNFSQILEDNLVLFDFYCRKQNIKCYKEIETDVFIKADPNAINRIVNNLIENAIKFSDAKGAIEITLKNVDDNIQFSVRDEGIGIPHNLHKKIFEPYYQINHKKTGLQGMGLGLPIVKAVIDSLGGYIKIDSEPQIRPGTMVIITLNKYADTEDVPVATTVEIKANNYYTETDNVADTLYDEIRQSILLIEDNNAMLAFLLKKLKNKYNVFCAVNGAEGLKKLSDLPVIPDLILSDIMMDVMDGYAFAKAILSQKAYNHIPIIFLSAKSTSADKLKSLRLGAIDLVSKPFSFEVLNQKIETVLWNIEKQKRAILNSSISNLKAIDKITYQNGPGFERACQLYSLSAREIEIAKLIAEGVSYKTIAKKLFIAERTVTKHVSNIFQKVDVNNKMELIKRLHINIDPDHSA